MCVYLLEPRATSANLAVAAFGLTALALSIASFLRRDELFLFPSTGRFLHVRNRRIAREGRFSQVEAVEFINDDEEAAGELLLRLKDGCAISLGDSSWDRARELAAAMGVAAR